MRAKPYANSIFACLDRPISPRWSNRLVEEQKKSKPEEAENS
jgi:hypothetical protein